MRVLLVNPNLFQAPPVPPIGLEYVAGCLQKSGCDVHISDLTFSSSLYSDLSNEIERFNPEIACITVRNIDSVLFEKNEFYLDGIRSIIRHIKGHSGLQVIAGGAGVVADPSEILEYIEADFLVVGPAEGVINDLIDNIRAGNIDKKIWGGSCPSRFLCRRITDFTDYRKYSDLGGIAGFQTHAGCSSSCIYCIEANTIVSFRDPDDIVRELTVFAGSGFDQFHLCDSEFNEDLDHSIDFCSALRRADLGIEWSLYMKPTNYNQKLFRLMRDTGARLITLSVDSFKKCPLYWSDIEKIVFNSKSADIRIVVDFITGFPYEDENLLKWCLDFFLRIQPDRVNINTYIRLYRNLIISKIISRDNSLNNHIIGNPKDGSMLRPVFYSQIDTSRLKELISGCCLFAIEGETPGVNYMK